MFPPCPVTLSSPQSLGVGSNPCPTVATNMPVPVITTASFRPKESLRTPRNIPPNGRAANVAVNPSHVAKAEPRKKFLSI